jgi:hypothetical protein
MPVYHHFSVRYSSSHCVFFFSAVFFFVCFSVHSLHQLVVEVYVIAVINIVVLIILLYGKKIQTRLAEKCIGKRCSERLSDAILNQ